MDFTDKGKIKGIYIQPIIVELNGHFFICFIHEEAKVAKAEVNLMSLLSTLEDITDFRYEEEQQEAKESKNTPKVPRTNSLEDLGIKVLQDLGFLMFLALLITGLLKIKSLFYHLVICCILYLTI